MIHLCTPNCMKIIKKEDCEFIPSISAIIIKDSKLQIKQSAVIEIKANSRQLINTHFLKSHLLKILNTILIIYRLMQIRKINLELIIQNTVLRKFFIIRFFLRRQSTRLIPIRLWIKIYKIRCSCSCTTAIFSIPKNLNNNNYINNSSEVWNNQAKEMI